ncbi:hypothetical protein ALQ78_101209 [Pseudomonas syringae pv. aptata]|nr:hypothetical protein ALO65_101694 [Pseudomonas syringae pv. papulans]RMM48193.1 hypothetical protein ALQ78_101209 [Pseudomonas syringae pv. aptata]RMS56216.1 hypothetical protein ALP63_101998 [Pseudomonas syringae pv. aceris]RMN50620.1 hypothetical protein ALQ60_101575 [Pseudomonas syringae pv. papulans]RMN69994.1 hypothetical protein ALQ56_102237 [Pseudomonas syringae pv. papulans]
MTGKVTTFGFFCPAYWRVCSTSDDQAARPWTAQDFQTALLAMNSSRVRLTCCIQ